MYDSRQYNTDTVDIRASSFDFDKELTVTQKCPAEGVRSDFHVSRKEILARAGELKLPSLY